MKKLFCVILFVFLSYVLWAQALSSQSKNTYQNVYVFSAVSPSGHTLCYDTLNGGAILTYPKRCTNGANQTYPSWDGFGWPNGSIIIPDSVVDPSTNTKYPVEKIRQNTFWTCSGITAITIPSTIKKIESNAFDQCSGLTTVYYNADSCSSCSNSGFSSCSNLTTLVIGNNVRAIPNDMFKACSNLSNFVIPNSVERIGNMAFRACSSLTSITIGRNVKYIGNAAFALCNNVTSVNFMADSCSVAYSWLPSNTGSFNIGNNVKIIPRGFCKGLNNLNTILIPDSVYYIGQSAFYGCNSLLSITLPSSLDSIGEDAFYGCNGLNQTYYTGSLEEWCEIDFANAYANPISKSRNLYISDSLITHLTLPTTTYNIKNYSFYGDTNIISITMPNTTHSIGECCFASCTRLTSISFSNSLYTIERSAFANCNALPTVSLPDSLTFIGDSAFANCSNLTSISFPNSLLQIGSRTFFNCINLTSFFSPNSLISIGQYAFQNCIKLDSITLGMTIGHVGIGAFLDCDSIKYTNYKGTEKKWCAIQFENWSANPVYYSQNLYINNLPLRHICIEDSITKVNSYAFWNDTMLSTVKLMGNISSIGEYAFRDCDNLDTLFLGRNIDTIGEGAFLSCGSLKFIKLYTHIPPVLLGGNGFNYIYPYPVFATPCNSWSLYMSEWGQGNNNNWTYADFWIPMEYTINVSSNSPYSYGTVSIMETNACSSTAVIKATPSNYHYYFVQWNDGVSTNPRTIDLVQDTSFSATFEKYSYTITCTSNNTIMGSVSGGGTAEYLDTISITATANTGYHFTRWNDNNTSNPRTITVTSNQTFTAYFDYNQYTLSVCSNNVSYGNVIGGGSYHYNTNHTINASANYGYHFTMWSDGNTSNPRTITITQDTSFTAIFTKNTYSVSISCNDAAMGNVSGGGSFEYLDTTTLSATAIEHHHFVRWNDGNISNPRQYVVTGDASITAIFAIDTHHVNVGSCNIAFGSVSGGGDFVYGTPAMLTAMAYSGYQFICWSNGDTHNPYTFAVLQDTSLTAIFGEEIITYVITATSADETMGFVEGGGTFNEGSTCSLTAIPNEDYHFSHWQDGNTSNPRTITVTSNAAYTAYFEAVTPAQYTITVTSANTTMGTVSGGGTYNEGTTISISAIANEGYRFDHWHDNNTQNPRTITITGDATYIAYFVATQGIDDMIADVVNVYTLDGQIVVETELKEGIGIYDIVGHKMDGERKNRFDVPVSGVYLVKIGSLSPVKVVVVK